MVSQTQNGVAGVNRATDASPQPSNASRPCIGIVAAFRWEISSLMRQASRHTSRNVSYNSSTPHRIDPPHAAANPEPSENKRPDPGRCALLRDGTPVVIAISGAGAGNSFRAAQRLAAEFPLGGLVTLGFAGGLIPGLRAGDVVLADVVIDQDSQERFACSTDLLPVRFNRRGNLLSAGAVIISSEEKFRLGEKWQAVAVDMESAGVARAAAAAGVPFCAVKSITDSADESLSIDFSRCQREDKNFSFWAIACQGLSTLNGARDLWRLARNARRAASSLAAAIGGA